MGMYFTRYIVMVKHNFLNNLDVIFVSLLVLIVLAYVLYRIIRRSMWFRLKRTTVQEYRLLINMAMTDGAAVIVEYMHGPRHILVNGRMIHREGNDQDRLQFVVALSKLLAKGHVGEVVPGMFKLTSSGVDRARRIMITTNQSA